MKDGSALRDLVRRAWVCEEGMLAYLQLHFMCEAVIEPIVRWAVFGHWHALVAESAARCRSMIPRVARIGHRGIAATQLGQYERPIGEVRELERRLKPAKL